VPTAVDGERHARVEDEARGDDQHPGRVHTYGSLCMMNAVVPLSDMLELGCDEGAAPSAR